MSPSFRPDFESPPITEEDHVPIPLNLPQPPSLPQPRMRVQCAVQGPAPCKFAYSCVRHGWHVRVSHVLSHKCIDVPNALACVYHPTQDGLTGFIAAAQYGHLQVVTCLLYSSCRSAAFHHLDCPPRGVRLWVPQVVQLLLDRDADINQAKKVCVFVCVFVCGCFSVCARW